MIVRTLLEGAGLSSLDLMVAIDKNGDHNISRKEFLAFWKAVFVGYNFRKPDEPLSSAELREGIGASAAEAATPARRAVSPMLRYKGCLVMWKVPGRGVRFLLDLKLTSSSKVCH